MRCLQAAVIVEHGSLVGQHTVKKSRMGIVYKWQVGQQIDHCQNKELNAQLELPNRTRDGEEFELLANCFGPEDVGTAMESGASGVGLLRSSYMMMPGHAMDEQEQYLFYTSCLAAAKGKMVTVRTFDFGADRTMADAYQGVQSSKLPFLKNK